MGDFFAELRRRHIYRIGAGYVVVAWAITQFVDVLSQIFALPPWVSQPVLIVLAIGFPITLLVAWMIEGKAHEAVASAVRSPATTGCVSKVVEIGFGASPSGLSFAAVRPRGQGFRRRLADRGFPIHRLCASGFGRKRGAPRGASALFRDTAARSVF